MFESGDRKSATEFQVIILGITVQDTVNLKSDLRKNPI